MTMSIKLGEKWYGSLTVIAFPKLIHKFRWIVDFMSMTINRLATGQIATTSIKTRANVVNIT
ncbi:hypothetical protein D3C80_949110 [compost metagenome]